MFRKVPRPAGFDFFFFFFFQTVTRKAKKARARMEKDAGRLETIADVGNAADFVRVARDAGAL